MNFNIFKRRVFKEVLLGFIDFSDAQIKCQWFVVIDGAKSPCLLKQPLTAGTSRESNPARDQSFASKGVAEFSFLCITSPPFPCRLEKEFESKFTEVDSCRQR